MRTALVTIAILLLAALSMARQWGGPIYWETDALFYQAKSKEIRGEDHDAALRDVFGGPLSRYERDIEADNPQEPARVGDPDWVSYSSQFYERRLLLPAAAAALDPLLGLHALETISLLGFVLVPALLFGLLRQRLSLGVSAIAAAAFILWPPLRDWSIFPLSDSFGLVFLIAGLLSALWVLERGYWWLVPWVLCVGALSVTRDIAFVLVICALAVALLQRNRRSVALFASGALAAVPALLLHGVSMSQSLAYVFADHTIPSDTSWSFVASEYLPNLDRTAGKYFEYALANPEIVLLVVAGVACAIALAPKRDPLSILLLALIPGYGLMLLVSGPTYSSFRYELVLLPLMALGFGYLLARVVRHAGEVKAARDLTGGPVGSSSPS